MINLLDFAFAGLSPSTKCGEFMKKCTKCRKNKSFGEYHKSKSAADGYAYACKDCRNKYIRDLHRDTKESRKLYKRNQPKDKVHARQKVKEAIKKNKLKKGICRVCGDINVDAHHFDYSKPLEVEWFCRRHHLDTHAEIRLWEKYMSKI